MTTARVSWRTARVPAMKPPAQHTHGTAAGFRTVARRFILNFLQLQQSTPYFFQMSASDQYRKHEGSRLPYWPQDLAVPLREDVPSPGSVMVLIDVDYYLDMRDFLRQYGEHAVALYTFAPQTLAGRAEDKTWHFNKDQEVEVRVAGGGTFRHRLWDWEVDNLAYFSASLNPFNAIYRTYAVEPKFIGSSSSKCVFVVPTAEVKGLWAWFAKLMLGERPLQRLKVDTGKGYYRLDSLVEDTLTASVCLPGWESSGQVDVDRLTELFAAKRVSPKTAITPGLIRTYAPKAVNPAIVASVVQVATAGANAVDDSLVGMMVYQFAGTCLDKPKPLMTQLTTPIIPGSCSGTGGPDDEKVAVRERITTPQAEAKARKDPKSDQLLENYACEFVNHFVGLWGNTLHPVDIAEVRAKQNRPTQAVILDRAEMSGAAGATASGGATIKSSAFLKKESYGGVKPGRLISTVPPELKLMWSRYCMSLSDFVKQQHFKWYAFGNDPAHVAERVAEVCKDASHIAETDYSRFDGHVSEQLRKFERKLMLTAFEDTHAQEIEQCLAANVGATMYLPAGTVYSSEYARLSGSPETSVMNTIDNTFIMYVAYREDGLTPEAAWEAVQKCVAGGDDGLIVNIGEKTLKQSAAMIGQTITVDMKTTGDNIKFLSRVYTPGVWSGERESMCSLERTLRQVNLCANEPTDPVYRWREKWSALALSDRNTPIIRDYLDKMEEFKLLLNKEDISDLSWTQGGVSQYPNQFGYWMEDVATSVKQSFDYESWLHNVNNAVLPADLMDLPAMFVQEMPPPSSYGPVIVDGHYIPAAEAAAGSQGNAVVAVPAAKPRRGPRRGKARGTAMGAAAAKRPSN